MNVNERLCAECGRPLKGRPDKRFCCDSCRNTFNNKQNSDQVNLMRNINNTLRKNRRIMEEVMDAEKKTFKCHRLLLIERGHDFRYHTHQYINTSGQVYYFCYDYGYLQLENDWVLLVRRKEKNDPSNQSV